MSLNRHRLKTARINKLSTIVTFNRIHNPHALPLGRGETMTGHVVAENTRSYVARVRLMGDVITSSKSKLRLQIAFFHDIVFKLKLAVVLLYQHVGFGFIFSYWTANINM